MILQDDGDGTGGRVVKWDLPGVPPSDAEITTALAEKDGVIAAEKTRITTFVDDTEAVDLLERLKSHTAAQIDTYITNNIVLTGATIADLRQEIQQLLRVITRKQLKVMAEMAHQIPSADEWHESD